MEGISFLEGRGQENHSILGSVKDVIISKKTGSLLHKLTRTVRRKKLHQNEQLKITLRKILYITRLVEFSVCSEICCVHNREKNHAHLIFFPSGRLIIFEFHGTNLK